jgi:hypothetical protein
MIAVNPQSLSDCGQRPVCSMEEGVGTGIILRSEPFPFHDAPKRLGNVQPWRIRGNAERKKASLFPNGTHPPNLCIATDTGIVGYYKCLFSSPNENRSGKSTIF